MRLETLIELASSARTRLSSDFLDDGPLRVPADRRGWFRLQRAYNAARALVHTEGVMRRIVPEAALDDIAEGSHRLGTQVDPTNYTFFVDGITPTLEIVLDAAKQATTLSGVEMAAIMAASRMHHPLDARTLARLTVRYAGDQPGEMISFGLSNDERTGQTFSWERAFAIVRRDGLAPILHGGELLGPNHLREVVSTLDPTRLGHGIHADEDPTLLDTIITSGVNLEACSISNVSLGVHHSLDDVPLRTPINHGAQIALSADDPPLFRSRPIDQYEIARTLGRDDAELTELVRGSIHACLTSPTAEQAWLAEVNTWLATPDQALRI